jgi:hypothetical protein
MQGVNKMPSSDTYFKPGQSGNPRGRTPGKTVRDALRAQLAKPTARDPNKTGYELWARRIIEWAETAGYEHMLEVAKFLEGASPPDKGMPFEDLEYPEACDQDGNPVEP